MSRTALGADDASFFGLYSRGALSENDIDDFVGKWHDEADERARGMELHEYLGLAPDEYELWVLDAGALPCILEARKGLRPLETIIQERVDRLNESQADRVVLFLLTNWLGRRRAKATG